VGAGGGRGSGLPREVLREVSDGSAVGGRGQARALVLRSQMLPRPLWNPRLYDMAGRFIAIPDAWFDDVGMAWEIDSKEWHLSPADYEATVLRRSVLGALDVELVQTLPQTLTRAHA